ncbi:MAG: hypothetical protein JWR00_1039 [Rubritepida sp.]|nr:hypothetical protein [Rubritepida sp.]
MKSGQEHSGRTAAGAAHSTFRPGTPAARQSKGRGRGRPSLRAQKDSILIRFQRIRIGPSPCFAATRASVPSARIAPRKLFTSPSQAGSFSGSAQA